ncbi:MAG: hypothetical protein JHC98_07605 [Thermoleophilaceae bacterium]|nr:hypothetical protein [Thermoleophilaceae bacterium]
MALAIAGCALMLPAQASAAWGNLDADFGVGGKLTLPGLSDPVALRVLPDGKILVATSPAAARGGGRIARLTPEGALDPSFGVGGVLTPPGAGSIHDFELLADGRMVMVAGENRLIMLNPDGSTSAQFGDAGILLFGSATNRFKPCSVAVQDGAKVLVSGGINGHGTTPTIIRLDDTGAMDTSFGESGFAKVDGFGVGHPGGSALGVTSSGGILLGLDYPLPFVMGKEGVAKFSRDGVRDVSFGDGGVASFSAYGNSGVRVTSIAALSNDRFVAFSNGFNVGSRGTQWIDRAPHFFDSNGKGQGTKARVYQSGDATLALGGRVALVSPLNFAVLDQRLQPDQLFDRNGFTSAQIGPCSSWKILVAGSDGSIMGAGRCQSGAGLQLVRFLGTAGGNAAPQPRLDVTILPKYYVGRGKPAWLRKLSGVADPFPGIAKVGVAILKVDSKLIKRRKMCRWLSANGTKSTKRAAVDGQCSNPRFMPATGLGNWTFKIRRPLPPGKYKLYVRATLPNGRFNPLNVDADSYAEFKVKRLK